MKTIHQAALVTASAVLLAACASSGGTASTRPAAQPQQHAPGQAIQDAAYVAMVERVARRRGVTVRWFHPPVKRAEGAAADVDNQ
ncbi:hypothetical protein [Luteimonas arsenica]|uniref:hypothetical protein n=1 Tax=Luteimonas arsenica TaxID=1586242 RepID=UPI0010557C14|nr:hypothetical protein [Luteimonas arsenica]